MSAYTAGRKDDGLWTMVIMQPEWISPEMFQASVTKAANKLGDVPETLRLETFDEGLSVQILHIGPNADEGPVIARIHDEFIPQNQLIENGHHHEIYLNGSRRTAPEKLKTVLRQPVKRLDP